MTLRRRWAMLTSRPSPHDSEWIDEDALGVFVPGLMGAGILLSAGILVSDGIRKLFPSRGVRRRINVVRGVRRIVVDMAEAAGITIEEHNLVRRERRSRWLYALVSLLALPAAYFVARWGFNAFSSVGSSLEGNAMAVLYGTVMAVALAGVGLVAVVLVLSGATPPRRVDWLVAHTAVGRLSAPPDGVAERAVLLIPNIDKGANR